MPLKLSVGLTKKIGMPNYGSLGASCHVEVELDRSLLEGDLDRFHQFARNSYAACATAIHDELARQHAAASCNELRLRQAGEFDQDPPRPGPVLPSSDETETNGHRMSQKQHNYARQLASQIRGLGLRRLDQVIERMFVKPLDALTSLEASGLIDTLRSVKAGEVSLEAILPEAAA